MNTKYMAYSDESMLARGSRGARWGLARMGVLAVLGLGLGAACDKGAGAPQEGASGRVAMPDRGATAEAPPVVGGRRGAAGEEAARGGSQGANEAATQAAKPGEKGGAVEAIAEDGSARSFGAELARVYEAWSAEERSLVDEFGKSLDGAIAREGLFREWVKKVYAARPGRLPIMSRDGALTEDADYLVQAIEAVPTHGLDPKPYELDRLGGLLETYAKKRMEIDAARPASDSAVWKFLLAHRPAAGAKLDEASLRAKAEDAGLSDRHLGDLSEARKQLNQMIATQRTMNSVLAELDAFLVGKLHRWVFDMRFAKKAHPFLADKTDEDGLKRVSGDLVKVMAVDLGVPGAVQTLAESVVPRFPDYEPTRQALARYRDLATRYATHLELGKEVEKAGPGKSGDYVSKLEERLAQEGYYNGVPTGRWSDALEQAVNAYQETHQLKVTGRVEKIMRGSLNRTYAERAQMIELSLARYRESDLHQGTFRFGETPLRARVNIPAMEARFFVGTELGRKHRVIVGNNDTETDAEKGKRGKLNQTRLLTAEMATVVLNPVWNVPKRIKEQELDLLLGDEPDYYEKHNFKVEVNPDGTERVVQQPGPGNALGEVKFLFPNQFAIYMHDTPKKKLFERPVRAFSHGCMRTESPVDLARWILVEVDKEMTNEEFDAILAKREERHFALNPKIPISTDYVTTTIDEQGRIVFLADVYGFDKDYFDGKTPYKADKDFPMTIIF